MELEWTIEDEKARIAQDLEELGWEQCDDPECDGGEDCKYW